MRNLRIATIFPLLAIALSFVVAAQQAQARRGSWQDVENLPPGTQISVQPLHGARFRCQFESATDNELTCEVPQPTLPCLACILLPGGPQPVGYAPIHFDPRYVRNLHIEHPAANMTIGLAVGAGLGVGLGSRDPSVASRGFSEAVGGVLLGTAGTLIGKHVPFIRGTVVFAR